MAQGQKQNKTEKPANCCSLKQNSWKMTTKWMERWQKLDRKQTQCQFIKAEIKVSHSTVQISIINKCKDAMWNYCKEKKGSVPGRNFCDNKQG